MLVLTRKVGERIWVTGEIWITLVEVEPGKARIGIEAPSEVVILREEVITRSTDAPDPATES